MADDLTILISTPIVWSDTFCNHIPLIDSQHKKLFILVEKLRISLHEKKAHEGPISGEDLKPVKVIMQWLVMYCITHFDSEEKVQELVKLPDVAGHKAVHKNFFETCRKYMEVVGQSIDANESLDVGPVFQLLVNWLVSHVCGLDSELGKWCESQGVDRSAPELQDMTDMIPDDLPDLTPKVKDDDMPIYEN
jgi:hemerythrin